ncbi:Kinase-like protein [Quillaja saponaria]|uniref:Kinase-like protein n=1 Tax=Quillaja saponaria TaxID=32244 RepID=A0AAD7PQG7_QUISA|nr:Kinase-like protein [Quillaja saponaria]
MKIGLQLFLVLKAWVVVLPLFFTLSYSELANNDTNPGFISIDCGVTESYTDETTGIWYQPDTDFIETGTNHALTIRKQ